jgi:hypothetical protein
MDWLWMEAWNQEKPQVDCAETRRLMKDAENLEGKKSVTEQ